MSLSRYVISVESKHAEADTLDDAINTFGRMMWINRANVRADLITKGESIQVYGFCQGTIRDCEWINDNENQCEFQS